MARWRARRSQAGQQQRSQQEVAATHIGYCAPANTCAAGRRVAWRAAKRLASIPATSVASGTAVRFEPGQQRTVELVDYAGTREVYGFRGLVQGAL